jgi:acyl dehydratase
MGQAKTAQVGDEIPPFERATGLASWNRFAAVNYEFVPIHMDDEAGQAAGYPSAFGMGSLQWSYLHNVLREWLGEDGRILRLACQFRAPNIKGQTVTTRGVIREIHEIDAGKKVELDVWTEDQEGKQLAPGSATVLLS